MLTGSCHCGAASWTYQGPLEGESGATACNCTLCRRYGTLWIYGYERENVTLTGPTTSYMRTDGRTLRIHFCPTCGAVAAWRASEPDADGRTRIAVNVRLSEPGTVADLPIDHFDGLDTFDDLPRDGRTVRDLWF